jgi:hypothetical protein
MSELNSMDCRVGHDWKRSRPPLHRLCTLDLRSTAWPEEGAGVWQIIGFCDMGDRLERWLLRRVMPGDLRQAVGQDIHIDRISYEDGFVQIFRGGTDLFDPRFQLPNHEIAGRRSGAS